jgi:tetratricopeptide (TPR) repeat protein
MALAACDSPEEKAEAYYQRGLELLEAGDEARARVEFRNAIREVGTYMDPYLVLARLNLEDRALRPAFRDYLRVAEQDPTNLEAQVALSQISFAVQDWDAFERHSSEAITLASDDPQVQILDTAQRYRQAVQDEDGPARSAIVTEAEALQQTTPDSEILRQILIDGYMFEQRYEAAKSQVEDAIAADPQNPDFYNYKIQILAVLQDNDGIEAELYRLTEVFPDDPNYAQNLLRYLISRGKTQDAETFLRARVAASSDDEKEAGTVVLVQFLLATQGSAAALAELDAAVSAAPDSYTLRALQASLGFDTGDREAAISAMEQLIAEAEARTDEEAPVDPVQLRNIKVTLAQMLNQSGNRVGARSLIEQVLAEDETVVSALKMQARWMIEEDNTDGAINAMRTALATAAQDAEAMTIMASAYQRAGNLDLMLNFLSLAAEASGNAPEESLRYAAALRADDKAQQAESILIPALRLQPQNLQLLTSLGTLYIELDDVPRARQVVESLRSLGTDEGNAAAAGLELELVALESGTGQALAMLETMAEESGGDIGVRLALVRGRLESGDVAGALELSNALVAEDPENNSFLYYRAMALAANRDYETATAELSSLVERAPTAVPAWLQLARLQGIGGQAEAAQATLDSGLEANPGSGDLLWAKASYLQSSGDIDGAIAIYEGLYEQNSQSVVVANNLASLLTTFRRDDASLERARVISRRLQGTDVPAFQDTYGWIQHRTGNSEEALVYLEPAAAGLPNDPAVQYHLGVVYQALNRPQEALAQMRRALEVLGPLGSTELAQEIRDQLALLEASTDQ